MDKKTKTQFSIGFFIIGFICFLSRILSILISLGFSGLRYLFYLGLICMSYRLLSQIEMSYFSFKTPI